MEILTHLIEKKIKKLKEEGLYRTEFTAPQYVIDFYSNDYLGVATKMLIKIEDFNHIMEKETAPASRLLGGKSPAIDHLEDEIERFFGWEEAIIFASGFQANMAAISIISSLGMKIYYDALIHASIRDGIKAYARYAWKFPHNDFSELISIYKKKGGPAVIVIESLYSITGDYANYKSLVNFLNETQDVFIFIDEAHTAGWYPSQNLLWHTNKIPPYKIILITVTFGKAFGVGGAALLTTKNLYEIIVNYARPFIYTTRLPAPFIAGIYSALNAVKNLHEERKKINENIEYATRCFKYPIKNGPIFFIPIESSKKAIEVAEALRKKGYGVFAIRPPTSPQPGLRIIIHSFNSFSEIEKLAETIGKLV